MEKGRAVSSRTNIVVVITHVEERPMNSWFQDFHDEWMSTVEDANDLHHTDVAIDSFFRSATFSLCPEGNIISFVFAGNFINRDTFMEALLPFLRLLITKWKYTSATFFFQPHDMETDIWKFDGTHEEVWQPPKTDFSFDVKLERLLRRP